MDIIIKIWKYIIENIQIIAYNIRKRMIRHENDMSEEQKGEWKIWIYLT